MIYLANILITAVVALASAWGFYNYAPLSIFEISHNNNLGSTVTSIAGTDSISGSRTTINTNFTNLNAGKVETSTTTMFLLTTLPNLVSVGTLTTGTWNASTLTASFGGTGSTTLANKRLMFGNTTSGFQTINFGTSGQFLTSGGEATLPSWTTSVLDQTISYNWTGSYFGIKNLNASSTSANPIVLNGVSLNTPSTQGASSTALINDGNGNLKFQSVPSFLAASTTAISGNTTSQNYQPAATTTATMAAGNVLVSVNYWASIANVNLACIVTLFIDNVNKDPTGVGLSAIASTTPGMIKNLGFTYTALNLSAGTHYFTLMRKVDSGGGTCNDSYFQMVLTYLGQ